MNENETVGERIKSLRQKKGISQKKLGNEIGLCQNSISKIERGETQLTLEHLHHIAIYFNKSTDYICTGKDVSSLLSYLEKYIFIECVSITEGNEKMSYPKLKIDKTLFDYLMQIAKISSESMPDEVRELWTDITVDKFYDKDKDNSFQEYTTVIPLPEKLILPDDQKNDWKQRDLIRELNRELTEISTFSE